MQTTLIGNLLTALLKFLKSDEDIKIVVDALLDKVEDRIAKSENKFDDVAIGAIITLIRKSFDIVDNDTPVTINTETVNVTTTEAVSTDIKE